MQQYGIIFACARLDQLVAEARAGDMAALEALIKLLPRDMPPAALRARRDAEIRMLGRELVAAHPGASARSVAKNLAMAGRRVEAGHASLPGIAFAAFTSAEADELVERIKDILEWCASDREGSRWPAWRQIARILAVSSFDVEMTRPTG